MDLSLKGNRAIVCGSTDGIGKASALLMAERGASITLVARNKEKLNATLTELSIEHGQNHATVCADFNKPNELKQMIQSHLKESGYTYRILVNNSGGPHGGPLIEAKKMNFVSHLSVCLFVIKLWHRRPF